MEKLRELIGFLARELESKSSCLRSRNIRSIENQMKEACHEIAKERCENLAYVSRLYCASVERAQLIAEERAIA